MTTPEATDADLVARIANELYVETPAREAEEKPAAGWVPAWEPYPVPDLSGGGANLPLDAGPRFYFLRESPPPPAPTPGPVGALDVQAVRADFPALHQEVNGKPLIWLDNAATTHKPHAVIGALLEYYSRDNSNIHRGAHTLAERATEAFEGARGKVQRFLGAESPEEIIFTRGTTEGINLVAQTYGRRFVQASDEIVVTELEHHSNLVPWQMLCEEQGARLRVAPLDESGQVVQEEYEGLLGPRTRLVALAHVSNVLGTVLPLGRMIEAAHQAGARVLVDGAQGAPHLSVDVRALDVDFYVFSGHKLYGPTGIGVLYGKRALLEEMPPWQGGGSMIETVSFEGNTYQPPPAKFEAGTPHIAGVVGLGAAVDHVNRLGLERIAACEEALVAYGMAALATVPGLRLIGTAPGKVSVLTFVLSGQSPQEVGARLDREGIAVRSGHHCAQPALRRYGLTAAVRPSVAFYNTREEIDALVAAVRRA